MNWRISALRLCAGIIAGVALSAFVISWPSRLYSWPFGHPTPAAPAQTVSAATHFSEEEKAFQEKLDALKEKLDSYNKRTDDLQRLLTVLVGFSTVYAIGLALNALKEANDSAGKLRDLRTESEKNVQEAKAEVEKAHTESEKNVQQAKAEVEKARTELLSIFPLLSRMSENFDATIGVMLDILPTVDTSDKNYHDPTAPQREQIFFYEKTFAAAGYFNLQYFAKDASKIYQGLGNFYAISARTSRKEPEKATEQDDETYNCHLERARFYLQRAIKFDQENTGALNDMAYLELVIARPSNEVLKNAERFCKLSLEKDSNQQRARYNLGWLKQNHEPKDYWASVKLYGEAKDKPNWQQTEPRRRIAEILYNKACALVGLARKSTSDVQSQLLADAMVDLEAAFGRSDRDNETMREAFCGPDTKPPDGDLVFLMECATLKDRFRTLLDRVCGSAKSN